MTVVQLALHAAEHAPMRLLMGTLVDNTITYGLLFMTVLLMDFSGPPTVLVLRTLAMGTQSGQVNLRGVGKVHSVYCFIVLLSSWNVMQVTSRISLQAVHMSLQ